MKPNKFKLKKSRPSIGKSSALSYTNEFAKPAHQNKNKKYFKKKRDQKNSILVKRNNTIKSEKKKNIRKYYNYQKKCYFAKKLV